MDMVSIYDQKEILGIRKKLGLSPTEFAAKLGVSASAVSTWERGRRCPGIEIHKKLTSLLKKINGNGHGDGQSPRNGEA